MPPEGTEGLLAPTGELFLQLLVSDSSLLLSTVQFWGPDTDSIAYNALT